MKVLVTGGLGVNGAWTVRRLLNEGHDVVVMDTRPEFDLLPDIRDNFEFTQHDLRDVDGLTELMASRRIDAVAHLAAMVGLPADLYQAFAINAQGSVGVLEAAHRAGVRRVVYTSSKAVYAPIVGKYAHPGYEPVPEDYPRGPTPGLRAYGASKILSEEAGQVYAERYGLEFVALRFGLIYGPGKKARHGPIGLHSRIIENALLGHPTTVTHGGDQGDDMMYTKDVAQAVTKACTAQLGTWVYNIGTGRVATLHDLAAAVRIRFPDASINIGPGFEFLGIGPVHCVMDISRAQRDLGYAPEYDLKAGVDDYVESIGQLGLQPQAQSTESSW
ncbi:NAD-dependent epimerase/dehydratase family protein [Nocardia arthritidis]|uniref:NAD-dependent epimerase/dehydratase family protein n=1 Tax=Nocardia arthritidis TaxID=228602 RepID=UPI0007A4F3E9|nr:NAD-dependent epimerase/dehydratase family protein [Nocardia arthritidis]